MQQALRTTRPTESHDLRPWGGRATANVTIEEYRLYGHTLLLCRINGTWPSGWDYPTVYDTIWNCACVKCNPGGNDVSE